MAALTTQAQVDALARYYFKLKDGTEYAANTLSTAQAQEIVDNVASLPAKIRQDLLDLLDTATTAL